jgi:hypothetical protein
MLSCVVALLDAQRETWASVCGFHFFNRPYPSICIVALGSTHRLTEISTRNLPRPARKADNLAAICEPIV